MISGKENIKAFFESMKLTDDATIEAEITISVVAPPKAKGCGGRGAYIFYKGLVKTTITSTSDSLFIQA